MHDYYAILEVSHSATQAEMKRSYRRLVRLHHPDLNKDARDTHIKLLNKAYDVLSDPEKRAAYDAQRLAAQRRAAAQAALRRKQEQAQREPDMTWFEGFAGFVKELKKGLQEEK